VPISEMSAADEPITGQRTHILVAPNAGATPFPYYNQNQSSQY